MFRGMTHIHIFLRNQTKKILNRAKELYCDAAIFVFDFLLSICPKKWKLNYVFYANSFLFFNIISFNFYVGCPIIFVVRSCRKGWKISIALLNRAIFSGIHPKPCSWPVSLLWWIAVEMLRYGDSRHDFSAIIYYNFSRGLSNEDCFIELSQVFSKDCPFVRTVECWYLQFQRGLFVLQDDLSLSISEWPLYSSLKAELRKLFC